MKSGETLVIWYSGDLKFGKFLFVCLYLGYGWDLIKSVCVYVCIYVHLIDNGKEFGWKFHSFRQSINKRPLQLEIQFETMRLKSVISASHHKFGFT